MGLNFDKPAETTETTAQVIGKDEYEVMPFNIQTDKQELVTKYEGSPEVDALISQVSVNDLDTIVSFGADVAENIGKCSDAVLNSMSMSQIDDTSTMLKTLGKIMDKFDINEIKEDKGFFNKLFGNAKKQIEKILDKYRTMGDEVDKIYVQLKQYESG